ncbi:MAG: putative DNA binding domain-containing protein, partial [Victivallales bacterium]|nr:putative DNA binding domain-containing protein [Victivallales bacterium]
MIVIPDILRQIRLGEDSLLEFKSVVCSGKRINAPARNDMADELASMANAFGGVVLLGVDDKTKSVEGISEDKLDLVENWIRAICNDSIVPQLFCGIWKVSLRGDSGEEKCIIRIDVPRSLFVHRSPGGYIQRLGSSRRQMSPEVLARLFQQRSQTRLIRFDESCVETAKVDCLAPELWRRFRSPFSPADEMEFLEKLKIISTDGGGEPHPTISGILMASQHPEEHLPNAFIRAVAYRGTERNAMYQMDAEDICGPLDQQILRACRFVQRNMRVLAYKAPGRVDVPQYSLSAIFEAVTNAVAHRDYAIYGAKIRLQMFDDRLELYSPGMIANTMTIDSMPLRQYSRNELLTSLLARCTLPPNAFTQRMTFMDKRGEGVPIIFSESERLSHKRPEYRLIEDELILTIYPVLQIYQEENLTSPYELTVHEAQITFPSTIHDPTIHDPTIHDPTIHDPTIHDPTIHDPTI